MTELSFEEFPFTDVELTAAFSKVMSAEEARSVEMLDLIASVSDDLAHRVERYKDRARRQNMPDG